NRSIEMAQTPTNSRLLALALCAAYFGLTATATAAVDANKELEGTWKLVSGELDGQEVELTEDVRWVIKDGQVSYGGEPLAAMMIYAASTPAGIDLSFREPKNTYEGIFALDKDKLKICVNTSTTGPKD